MQTVVICEGHRLFGDALSQVLMARGYNVMACTDAPDKGAAAVGAHQPDLYLTGSSFPGSDGMAGLIAARTASPTTRVLVLSNGPDPAACAQSRQAGASGFVCKDLDLEIVVAVITAVLQGQEFFPDAGHAPPVNGREQDSDGASDLTRFLTPREREVLRRLVAGQDTASLALEMGVKYSTARTHIQSVLTKLGVHSKLEAVALVARHMALPEGSRR